jgi:NAD(P)-dependent dehydrogenase (short-subunit alcohol dehydrogenase family)
MTTQLQDKVVVITGGAGTIGRAFVRSVASAGARVVVADINLDAAAEVARQVDASGKLVVPVVVDITSAASIDALIDSAIEAFGRVDAVVNNAYPRNPRYGRKVEDVAYEDFCENTNTHLGGYFLVMQRFALRLGAQGSGSIVNMSSVYGVIAPRFDVYADTSMTMPVEYAAVKAGVMHLTRYFAQYFKKSGIRVNCISPGGIRAGQPADFLERYDAHCGTKGMLDAGDIAGTLLFLLSDDARYVTGQNIVVDDGFTL